MGKIILVTGAVRSGKSSFAEKLAGSWGREVIYCATAQAFDSEMKDRISLHRSRRPSDWVTVEEPREVAEKLADYLAAGSVILLDCLTLWLSNLLLDRVDAAGEPEPNFQTEIEAKVNILIQAARQGKSTLICVSNEVGWSLVPENKLGRLYRDLAGRVNQMVAQAAQQVYLVVAGCPLEIKAAGAKVLSQLEEAK